MHGSSQCWTLPFLQGSKLFFNTSILISDSLIRNVTSLPGQTSHSNVSPGNDGAAARHQRIVHRPTRSERFDVSFLVLQSHCPDLDTGSVKVITRVQDCVRVVLNCLASSVKVARNGGVRRYN